MSLRSITPLWVKRLVRTVVPERTTGPARARAGDQLPWMVSRENPLVLAFERNVLRRDPHLHRLVVHLTDHCNLNCRGCTHFSNIAKPAFAGPEQFDREFEALTRVFSGITEIYLLGGEPLLHPRVTEFMAIARRHFPRARINLMSNGVLVTGMPEGFWTAMRDSRIRLVCDLYPIGLDVTAIEELARTHGVELEWTDPRGEFFKLPIDVTGSQDAAASFHACGGLNNCPILRDGRLYPCAYAAYSDLVMERFDLTALEPADADSIAIDGSRTPWEVFDFLCRPVPWCRFCDVDHVTTYAWARSERTLDEWTLDEPDSTTRAQER